MRRAIALGAVLVTAWSCQSPTEIEVVVSTDLPCDELLGTGIAVGAPGVVDHSAFVATAQGCDGGGGLVGTLVITPSGLGDTVGIEVVGNTVSPNPDACDRDSGAGCIIAKRALAFVPHTPLRLPIVLRQSCIG